MAEADRAIPANLALLLMPAVIGVVFLLAPLVGALDAGWMVEFVAIELFCFAAPALLAARMSVGTGALGLRWPSGRALLGAVLFGASFWYLNLVLVAPILAEWTSEADRALEVAIAADQPLWLELLILALVPAVCEELLVRGAIARGLAPRFGVVAAVLVSSAYFSLLHLSLARALPTAVLGAVLAIIAIRGGSLVPPILIHFLNNAAAVALSNPGAAPAVKALDRAPAITGSVALMASAIGLILMLRRR